MPSVEISSLDDPRIAIYANLKATNLTRSLEQFVVEGEKLVARLLRSRFPPASVLVTDRHQPRMRLDIPDHVTTYVLPHHLIDALVGFEFHRGVLACGERLPWRGWDELIPPAPQPFWAVVCPKIESPDNLGSIVRLADVFGVDLVLVGGHCPDPLSRRVLRVSMGTVLDVPVLASSDLAHDLDRLEHEFGLEFLATVTDADAVALAQVRCSGRIAVFLGNESEGLDPVWVQRCHHRVTIPMRSGAESLNVAVAAGITLYVLSNQVQRLSGS